MTTTTTAHYHHDLHMINGADVSAGPAVVEDRLRNHKVVAVPRSNPASAGNTTASSNDANSGNSSNNNSSSPRGRPTVRDMVASNPSQNANNNNNNNGRPRSLSAGRSRRSSSSLVQDLYDRMGVNLKKGQDTDFHQSTTTAIATAAVDPKFDEQRRLFRASAGASSSSLSLRNSKDVSPTATADASSSNPALESKFDARFHRAARGRSRNVVGRSPESVNNDVAEERRARSLSRGRLTRRWPPASLQETTTTTPAVATEEQEDTSRGNSNSNSPSPGSPTRQPTSSATRLQQKVQRRMSHGNSIKRVGATAATDPSPSLRQPSSSSAGTAATASSHSTSSPVAAAAVKDRVNIYGTMAGASKSARNVTRHNVDRQYLAQFSVRDHPPKVDIYQSSSNAKGASYEEKEQDPPSAPTAGEEEALGSRRRRSSSGAYANYSSSTPTHARAVKSGHLADAFLAAISPNTTPSKSECPAVVSAAALKQHTSLTTLPLTEIAVQSTPQDAASAISVDDDLRTTARPKSPAVPLRRSWQASLSPSPSSSSRLAATGSRHCTLPKSNAAGAPPPPPPPPLTQQQAAWVETLVEERVQAHVAELEAKWEAKWRRFLEQQRQQTSSLSPR